MLHMSKPLNRWLLFIKKSGLLDCFSFRSALSATQWQRWNERKYHTRKNNGHTSIYLRLSICWSVHAAHTHRDEHSGLRRTYREASTASLCFPHTHTRGSVCVCVVGSRCHSQLITPGRVDHPVWRAIRHTSLEWCGDDGGGGEGGGEPALAQIEAPGEVCLWGAQERRRPRSRWLSR